MPETLVVQQLYQGVNTGLQVEGTVNQTLGTGVSRQKFLSLSGDIVGRCIEGLQRVRSEMEMLRNLMIERSMLILSSVSLALVASGCCPDIPGRGVSSEVRIIGIIGGTLLGVVTDVCIVVLKKGKLKIGTLLIPPAIGVVYGFMYPEKASLLGLVIPGIELFGLGSGFLIKSIRERRR